MEYNLVFLKYLGPGIIFMFMAKQSVELCSGIIYLFLLLLFFPFFLAMPHNLWHLYSSTRDWTQANAVKAPILTARPPEASLVKLF